MNRQESWPESEQMRTYAIFFIILTLLLTPHSDAMGSGDPWLDSVDAYCVRLLKRHEDSLKAGLEPLNIRFLSAAPDGASTADGIAYTENLFGFDPFVNTLKRNTTVSLGHEEVKKRIEFVYRRYRETGIVSDSELDSLRSIDSRLDPLRTTYVTFESKDGTPRFVARIYDGSETLSTPALMYGGHERRDFIPKSPAKIPLEFEYPNLKLPPSRIKLEIGRAAKSSEEDDSLSLHQIFAWIATWQRSNYLQHERRIYAEALESRVAWYVKKHRFKIIAGTRRPPADLVLPNAVSKDFQLLTSPGGKEDRYILEINMHELNTNNIDGFVPPYALPLKTK